MMMLSPNFSLAELTRSETASRHGISNHPPKIVLDRLTLTAHKMEIVREICGDRPIIVFSGYRSERINALVGGSPTSDHKIGLAVDFKVIGQEISETISILSKADLVFDQLIDEFNAWVHIGFGLRKRRQILQARKIKGETIYKTLR